jgi:hypothetical protein
VLIGGYQLAFGAGLVAVAIVLAATVLRAPAAVWPGATPAAPWTDPGTAVPPPGDHRASPRSGDGEAAVTLEREPSRVTRPA